MTRSTCDASWRSTNQSVSRWFTLKIGNWFNKTRRIKVALNECQSNINFIVWGLEEQNSLSKTVLLEVQIIVVTMRIIVITIDFDVHWKRKINDKKVTRRFDDFMSSLSNAKRIIINWWEPCIRLWGRSGGCMFTCLGSVEVSLTDHLPLR